MAQKKCEFCRDGIGVIDYKDYERLRKFLTTRGKIFGRRNTGLCAYHQRKLALAIKRARIMGLLPFVESYYL